MILILTAALFLTAGLYATAAIAAGPMERWTYAATAALGMWLATSWILALSGTFSRPFLFGRLVVLIVAAAAAVWRMKWRPRLSGATLLLLAPLILWVAYTLWRGAVIPPVSHDALSYHLPKATMFVQREGFEYFSFLIPAIRTLPVNYELLLGETIAWTGTDRLTEWVSILFYALFVVSSAALGERWWGVDRLRSATLVLLAGGVPVVLLHSGAHKNDLMVASLMTSALVAAGRFFHDGDRRALFLCVTAAALAVGTKPQAGVLALALAPFILVRLKRDMRTLGALVAFSAIAFFVLGGAVYAINYVHEGSILNARDEDAASVEIVPYGDWSTLWQGPYVLLAAPFSGSRYALEVPWQDRPWFWRRYELYFSHLGVAFSVAAVAAPFAFLWAGRRRGWEKAAVTIAAAVTLAAILPVGFRPHGLYTISLPRYALFIVPVVFAWTAGALASRAPRGTVISAAALFVIYALDSAVNDAFAPFSYVVWAQKHPGTRVVMFDPNRAASIADRAAGPRETIAIDAGFGTWIQPAFGADLKRPVEFIPAGDGPPRISARARWVAVDRAYAAVWQHPGFDDLSEAGRYILRGTPTRRDTRTIEALRRDPRWQTVFYNPRMVQAVFRRR